MEKEVYLQMRAVEENHWWFVARRKIIDAVLSEILQNKENHVLDAGCGTGGNLELLSSYGDVTGIEINSDALTFARERNVGRVVQGSFPDSIPTFDCTFDLITLLDVLEHVEKDTETLRNLAKILSDDGHILLTVPAHRFLWSEHDVRHHHKRRYTRLELERVAREAGLKVNKITYFNMWLFPLVASIRMLKRLLPTSSLLDDDALPSAPLNSLFTFIFSSEAILIKKFKLPIGVSLLAVLLKNKQG